jgi:hypothetical protein
LQALLSISATVVFAVSMLLLVYTGLARHRRLAGGLGTFIIGIAFWVGGRGAYLDFLPLVPIFGGLGLGFFLYVWGPVSDDLSRRKTAGLPKRVRFWSEYTLFYNLIGILRYRLALSRSGEDIPVEVGGPTGDEIWESIRRRFVRRTSEPIAEGA